MRIFISWSGERSKIVAEALRDWLPLIVAAAEPWVSSRDIEKGSRPLEEIQAELDGARFGIAVLTPENLEEKWIHFESGGIAKAVGDQKGRLWTYLVGTSYLQVQGPLASFQHTLAEKADTRKLVEAINAAADKPAPDARLDNLFGDCWHRLEEKLKLADGFKASEKPKARTTDSMLAEILELVRGIARQPSAPSDKTVGRAAVEFWEALKVSQTDAVSLFEIVFQCPQCGQHFMERGVAPKGAKPPTSEQSADCPSCQWKGAIAPVEVRALARGQGKI